MGPWEASLAHRPTSRVFVRVGAFGVGPVQPRGPHQTVRRTHQPVERIRALRVPHVLRDSGGGFWLTARASASQVDGDRGRWLYRGFMVGNAEGNLSGRWRDTLSPSDVLGYEGCFVMSRRK